jgi:hypothetical protein
LLFFVIFFLLFIVFFNYQNDHNNHHIFIAIITKITLKAIITILTIITIITIKKQKKHTTPQYILKHHKDQVLQQSWKRSILVLLLIYFKIGVEQKTAAFKYYLLMWYCPQPAFCFHKLCNIFHFWLHNPSSSWVSMLKPDLLFPPAWQFINYLYLRKTWVHLAT